MDDTRAEASPVALQSSRTKRAHYLFVGATLVLAILETIGSLRGRPAPWSRRAILVALLGASLIGLMRRGPARTVVMIVTLLFVLDGFYALMNHG